MRLRVFNPDMDFESIKGWIPDERSHAMWCANRFQYPLDKDNFISVLSEMSQRTGDEPFVAVMDDDRTVGFLCYSLNRDIGEGKLKFVIVDPECQGKGIAQEMLHLIISYAFEDVETKRVSLNVFAQNPRAKKAMKKPALPKENPTTVLDSYTKKNSGTDAVWQQNEVSEANYTNSSLSG